ncbi:alpha-L-fucosidase [Roseimarinus sediminis]|uniref:alpha-L-fucosidase n=1 Tax=Roseimarinus sediminis TaxID=1610899 RepID=UPI003D19CF70
MRIIFLSILLSILFSSNIGLAQDSIKHEIASGKYSPNWDSFIENYECPEWFRDVKFGIWAHWSAQCIPEDGDWYARNMYIQGTRQYNFHVEHYGHPSEFGFMEFDYLWKAENWNPDKLMKLYKKAGAKYFMALANHHDNFDAYNSKYHSWNSVNIGPKKDIVGTWEKVARKNGLYFGVSNHSAHAWHWFQPAYAYDAEGDIAGVRYDAYQLTKEDGKGKWWEGLDPQELYTGPNMVVPDSITSIDEMKKWHDDNDGQWLEIAPKNNPAYTENWYLRAKDLVDQYQPDMVYFDNYGIPMEQAGLDVVAHYYNASEQWHHGKQAAVVTAKRLEPGQAEGIVEDYERGYVDDIKPYPWQTCTCIGHWHYDKKLLEENRYKTSAQVIHQLIDIVSKNGNLLLSIPMKGDGTIDTLEVKFLEEMADWMQKNGEAIYSTRPWKIYGEGPTKIESGMFNEDKIHFSSRDIRFTTKGNTLYALALGTPEDQRILIRSLSLNNDLAKGLKISEVKILGSKQNTEWEQTGEGLLIKWNKALYESPAIAFKIEGALPGTK